MWIVNVVIRIIIRNNLGQKRKKQCCECSGCLTKDCGSCKFCFDMPKFGGPGKKKKRCIILGLCSVTFTCSKTNSSSRAHSESPRAKSPLLHCLVLRENEQFLEQL